MGRMVNKDRRDQAFEKAVDVIDVGAVSEEQQLVTTEGGILWAFVKGFGEFIGKAKTLEDQAGVMLTEAQALTAPTNAAQDADLQRRVQRSREVAKSIEAHWEVAGVFYRMHKRLVSWRERGATKATDAGAIAQRLHNAYKAAEDRRVAEENARLEREAQAAAERKRAEEVAALEAEAVKAEEASEALSDRERVFVAHFLTGKPARECAKLAGYKDPIASAARLTTSDKVRAAIAAAQEAEQLKRQAAATREKPLEVIEFVPRTAAVDKVGSDRTTWKGVVEDEAVFIAAVMGGRYAIPADVLTVNQSKLTEYARSMHGLMNRWPGVKAVSSTTTV